MNIEEIKITDMNKFKEKKREDTDKEREAREASLDFVLERLG